MFPDHGQEHSTETEPEFSAHKNDENKVDFDTSNQAANMAASKIHHAAAMASFIPAIVRDPESGEIRWSVVVQGVLSAAILGIGASYIQTYREIAELRIVQAQRTTDINAIPSLSTKLEYLVREVESLKDGRAAATSDRFRASDAQRLEERMQKEISKISDRLDRVDRDCDAHIRRSR